MIFVELNHKYLWKRLKNQKYWYKLNKWYIKDSLEESRSQATRFFGILYEQSTKQEWQN